MPSKVWDDITYTFLNFKGSMLGLKLNHVSKKGVQAGSVGKNLWGLFIKVVPSEPVL